MTRCFVVGTGSFARSCIARLVSAGWSVAGLYSPDGSLADRWPNLVHVPTPEDVRSALVEQSVEVLFSLNNPWIIPASVLELPGLVTINYHDSPLPDYAGLHATSWALLHGEESHAITFHMVTPVVDAGDIVLQRTVPIEATDTAYTLNARCFETALNAFDDLLASAGHPATFPRVRQSSATGSYFGRRDRPPRAGVLDFSKPSIATIRLVRALSFGPTPNPLVLPKLFVGRSHGSMTFLTVARVESVQTHSTTGPGAIIELGNDTLVVGTADGAVRLTGFTALDGSAVQLSTAMSDAGLAIGDLLPGLSLEVAEDLSAYTRDTAVSEPFWVSRLRSTAVPAPPFELGPVSDKGQECPPKRDPGDSVPSPLPAFADAVAVSAKSALPGSSATPRSFAAACVAAFFLRLADVDPENDEWVDFGSVVPLPQDHLAAVFARCVPLRIPTAPGCSFEEFHRMFTEERDRVRRQGSYAYDAFPRYPDLRAKHRPHYSIAISDDGAGPCDLNVDADLTIHLAIDGDATVDHAGRLTPWQIGQIDRGLATFAAEAWLHPGRAVAQIALVEPAVHTRIASWNRTQAPIPERCVHTMFEDTASRMPDAPALRFAGRSHSYREVNELSDALARRLIGSGVSRGDVVAISFERSAAIVIAMLGVMKAGAAYLPIDPTHPAERVRAIFHDADVRRFLTSEAVASSNAFTGVSRDLVDIDSLLDDPTPTAAVVARVNADPPLPGDLAYVIYTSGSSGTPKGVEIRHRGLVNHSLAIAANYGLGPGGRLLFSASMSFDVAAEQIFPALFSGAEIVVRPEDLFDSFARFSSFVGDENITALVLPTAFWHEWVRELERTDASVMPALRSLSVGTEKALGTALEAWQRRTAGRVRFFQGYGPTETTITCTMLIHDGGAVDPDRPLSIGRPLPNMTAHILDRNLQPVPLGASGELLIGGVGLARGYRNNAVLTAERFIASPFDTEEVLYRTGDLARFVGSGEIVFLGRRDFQVKVRGFRVELGEIEQALRLHRGVDEAAVVLRDDYGTPELIGYVVADHAVSIAEILASLAAQLPDYMVPRTLVRLEQFPKTTNQKVDRRALPRPPRADSSEVVDARTPIERALIGMWSAHLGDGVSFGVTEEFFALGGDSLRCLAMLAEAERRYGRSVPLSAFVARPTIEFLADLLGDPSSVMEAPIVVRVQAGTSPKPLWLVHPVGGHVIYAERIRRSMGPEQTILGLQARGLDGRSEPLDTVEAMAELYVEHMRAEQPEGPYFVAGPSMGGLIALEIAQRLISEGQEVAMLAMIDTFGPGYPSPTSRLRKLRDQLETIRSVAGWRNRVRLARDRWDGHREPGGTSFRSSRLYVGIDAAVAPDGVSADVKGFIDRVSSANERATALYCPLKYRGRIHLIRAASTMEWSGMRFEAELNGWGSIAVGGVDCLTVQCTHFELVDRPPAEVGRALQETMNRQSATVDLPPDLARINPLAR